MSLPVVGQQMFHKRDILEDLDYLYSSLEEAHYNLYSFITEDAFKKNFEAVKASVVEDSLTLLETTSLFQAVISKANNGHTEIPFPGSSYGEYAYAGGTLFPLEVAFEEGKALVRKNWSEQADINPGDEIIRINGKPMEEILEKIYPMLSAERHYFKLAKLELYSFPRLYWQAFGKQDSFSIAIKQDGKMQEYKLNSISVIEGYEMKRNEVWFEKRELQFRKNTAYLRPGSFGGDEEKYRSFIDSSFTEIRKTNPPNLIIDLRNNTGGDDSYSDYLVSYIADQPFRWTSEFTLKTSAILKAHVRKNYDTINPYWKSVLTHEDGSIYPYEFELYSPQPAEKRYSGEVYVLVNRQSHSQSTVTAAQIQDYGWATLVGEETGEFSSPYASQYSYTLPKTGIEVKIAKGYMVRVNGSKKAEGVIPDIFIRDHLLDENDEILDGLLSRIDP